MTRLSEEPDGLILNLSESMTLSRASFYREQLLYTIADINKAPNMNEIVRFYQWQGMFHYRENWSQSYWEWTQ